MKKIIYIVLAAACSFLAFSCGNELVSPAESGRMTVTLNTCDPNLTKAGEDPFNENLIKCIDYYLYKGDDTTAAYRHGHLSTDVYHTKSFSIDFTAADYNALFAGSEEAVFYAVVNMPESTVLGGTGINDIRAGVLTANFAVDSVQEWFVMSGRTIFPKNAPEISVDVERVAAKLSLAITTAEWCYEDEADHTSTKWYSHPEAIKVEFENTFNKAEISGKNDVFTATAGTVGSMNSDPHPRTYYYTYPRQWEYGSDYEPYFFITMPVTEGSFSSETVKYCYYKIVLPGKQFERNHWYAYSIALKMLGSFERETPTVETPDNVNFYVHTWGGYTGTYGNSTYGEITGIKYLEVSENAENKIYYMYNQNSMKIPFNSSDVCDILNVSASSHNFSTNTERNRTSDVSVTLSGSDIVINHVLQNDTSLPNYEYAPITIRFTVQHDTGVPATDALYSEDITVVQYPAMYIIQQANDAINSKGGVFVNGSSSDGASYGGVNGLTGGNKNPNMYIIVSSVLSSSTDMLGDPRATTANNLSITTTLSHINGGTGKSLTYYYPVNADGSTNNIIAPKFRIASSYGVTSTITYENAQRRCATYQEDGYPAGRWRLATPAEIEYINKLSYDGVFPALFSSGSSYWCANGYCTDGTVTYSTTGNRYVRCVYDEWYWENTEYPRIPSGQRTTAMWGDAER